MFDRLLRFAIDHRWLILLATLAVAVLGAFNYRLLPIDAVPDITNVQVQINTEAPGYSPLEAEQRVTFLIETAISGLPNLDHTRSLSRYGLSQVTVVFKDGTDIYFARQLINERLQEVRDKLPPEIVPALGPIASGLGEIYLYTVETEADAVKLDGTPYDAVDLRTIQDWIIKPQLRTVAGVTEVNAVGGYEKQFLIAPDPAKLIALNVTLDDLVNSLSQNTVNAGAGYIERSGEQYLIRVPGQVSDIAELEVVVVSHRNGRPIYVRDVADVVIGKELRTGAATENGREIVLGTAVMLMGENSRAVAARVDAKMQEIRRSLPQGVIAKTVYNRTHLVDATIATVTTNLFEGAVLVVAVLFVFLGNIRAALITAMIIPLSMLFTITGMVQQKVSANLMSLGAIDFGIIVDGAVVIVENAMRRLGQEQHRLKRLLTRQERFEVVFSASQEARRVLLFGQLIIIVVYLPIFALQGVEGKMFNPMAFTVVTALIGAMLLTVTFVPAAIALFVNRPVEEKENRIMSAASRYYAPALDWSLANRTKVFSGSALLLLMTAVLFMRMGSEFIPNLNEGDIAMHALRIPGTSLTQAVEMQHVLEKKVKELPEVDYIFTRIGTSDIATDPMPPNVSDNFVMMKPRTQWPDPDKPQEQFIAELQQKVNQVPGNNYEFTQPIQMRFNELISGVRSDVAVKLFGDDLDQLLATDNNIAKVLQTIPGAEDVKLEQITGLPMLTVQLDRNAIARYGLNVADVQRAIAIALAGQKAGEVFDGDRRFDVVIRLAEPLRNDLDMLHRLPLALPGDSGAQYLPLSTLATLDLKPGPNQVSRENGKRRAVITANVRGRDIGSFVADAQAAIEKSVDIPDGYWLGWGGTFEQLQSASNRLLIVVPVALLLIFILLYAALGDLKDGLLVFTGVPFALTGGVLALALRGLPFSISAGVGFIALSGVAVLNGLVMVAFIRQLRAQNLPLAQAIRDGALVRLRPVLMTALVASLGFVPMAIALGVGAEVQRPLATVVIGGILSSTVLTLFVLPTLYAWAYRSQSE